ncbi:MAG: hemerythrin domain-containing protein [Rhodanobacter sp.]|nr:MAG: hemerythrin domain-containing protein [Rhodanobacter sp.]TAM13141.1 MAG: hemerythrin domain-containing protein [Rhodanobacter sp.]TAM35142.1 MAG: hemerythrin domain-containing protein [Rhodanobacter sp.]
MLSDNILLTDQHREMELGIAGLVDGSGSRAEFHAAVLLLRKHIYVEEVALFPVIDRDRARWMALAQMRYEHGDMWPHIESALALLEARADLEAMLDDAAAMERLLHAHDRKEEEAIYSVADRYVAAGGQPPLAEMFASTEIPAGWRCLRAPDALGDPGDRPVA